MKYEKWIWIGVIVLVVVIAAAVIGVNVWFDSGNVRAMGDQLRVNLSGTGYVINPETGEITGQSPMVMRGQTLESNREEFDGELEVLSYINESDGTITATKAVSKSDNGFWTVHYLESCLHYEQTGDDAAEAVNHMCQYHYIYYVYPENQDFLVVMVREFDNNHPYYVVLADSEEEALEIYSWFMENKPEE